MALQSFWSMICFSIPQQIATELTAPTSTSMHTKKQNNERSLRLYCCCGFRMCVVSDSLPTMSKTRCSPMTLIQSIEWYFKSLFSLATKVPWPCALNQQKNDLQVKRRNKYYANENRQFKIHYFILFHFIQVAVQCCCCYYYFDFNFYSNANETPSVVDGFYCIVKKIAKSR